MEQALVLRVLPVELAARVRAAVRDGTLDFVLKAGPNEVVPGVNSGERLPPRHFDVTIGGDPFKGILLDLPCPVEAQKTFDLSTYYKASDLSQMLIVHPADYKLPGDLIAPPRATPASPGAPPPELWNLDGGLTPPTWGIRSMHFRDQPVCTCPNQNMYKDRCTECNSIPKVRVEYVEEQLWRMAYGMPREEFQIVEEEHSGSEWDEPDASSRRTGGAPAASAAGASAKASGATLGLPRAPGAYPPARGALNGGLAPAPLGSAPNRAVGGTQQPQAPPVAQPDHSTSFEL